MEHFLDFHSKISGLFWQFDDHGRWSKLMLRTQNAEILADLIIKPVLWANRCSLIAYPENL